MPSAQSSIQAHKLFCPLWDPSLAAKEVERCAAKGSFAIAFSENPSKLGFPSLYSGEWDVLWHAC